MTSAISETEGLDMSNSGGFIWKIARSYAREEISRDTALMKLSEELQVPLIGAATILDEAVEDYRFFYEDDE